MYIDPNATKYLIKARILADGIVEKPDVVGAIFGQTEGLLGDELEFRDLQKSGRIGRIEVEITSKGGKSDGTIYISSSLDQAETAILAAALETVERVGPCKAGIQVLGIEDVRVAKSEKVVERAKELLNEMIMQSKGSSSNLTENVRQSVQIEEITTYGKDKCPAGPAVKNSESIIIVEGRSDVINLLKAGIKNAIAVEGTNIPKTVQDLSRERVATAFVDGDRGGELILRELFQVAEVDFVARAPRAHEVEELTAKQIGKCLRNKVPGDQYMEMNGFSDGNEDEEHAERSREDYRNREDRNRKNRREYEERKERKERFDSAAIDRYRKKEDDAIEMPAARRELAVPTEAHPVVYEEPKAEPAEPADKPSTEKKPNGERSLRGKKVATKQLTPEQEQYRDILKNLARTHNAEIIGADNTVIRQVAVKKLYETLKAENDEASAIVLDGSISQRIVDVSAEKGIGIIVGTRKGSISKRPADITIWTKEDLD